jgi:cell division protein FtsQ
MSPAHALHAPRVPQATSTPSASNEPHARRAPRVRRRRRRLVVIAVTLAVLLALTAAGDAALHSRLLAASTVSVTGERHETPHQVLDASGLAGAPSMLSVDPGLVAARIERTFPWVSSVIVAKHWPHTVSIAVTERTAVAEVPGPKASIVLVDVTGRRLGPIAPHQVLPRLEYTEAPGQPAASPSTLANAAVPGLLVAATLPPAFKSQVAVIQVNAAGWVTLHLTTPVSFVLGPASNLGAKYEDVAAVIARTTLHVGDVVDVSVPQAMTVTGP